MDVDIDICRAVGVPSREDGAPSVVRIDDDAFRHHRWGQGLRDVLDAVGQRSRRAQGLSKAVTYGNGMVLGSCRVYLLAHRKVCLGLLKVGPKRLYVSKGTDEGLVEINPLCVLDFYVVEGHQRGGLGISLFRAMLSREAVRAEKLAYDRPSPKLLGFLRKHFGLARYQAQSNNFVVYDAYFSGKDSQGLPSALKQQRVGVGAGASAGDGASAGGGVVAIGSAPRRSPSAPVLLGQRTPPDGASPDCDAPGGLALGAGGAAAEATVPPLGLLRQHSPARGVPPAPLPSPAQAAPRGPPAGPSLGGQPCGGAAGRRISRPPPGSGSRNRALPPGLPDARRRCAPGATGGEPLRAGRSARSASPLTQAAKSALAPSPLVQAMAQGLRI